jgi:hypothetical protein
MECVGTVWRVKHCGLEVIDARRDLRRPADVVARVTGPNDAGVLRAALRS